MRIRKESFDLISQKQISNFITHEIPAGLYEVCDMSKFLDILKKAKVSVNILTMIILIRNKKCFTGYIIIQYKFSYQPKYWHC